MNTPKKEPQNKPQTNIYISADEQGLNVCGMTNIEYLHLLHICREYVKRTAALRETSETLKAFNSQIRQTAETIVRKGAIVYSPEEI